MPMLTSGNADLLDPVVRKAYIDQFEGWDEIYSKVSAVESSDKPYFEETIYGGLGTAVEKREGEAISYVDPTPGWKKRFSPTTYALGFRVSMEMRDDDQLNIVKRVSGQLARSMRLVPETLVSNIYNRAFSSSYLGPDGHQLCDTDHPLITGSTYANRPTAGSVLSVITLKAGLNYFDTAVTHSGTPALITPKYLMVPPALRFTAFEILKSSGMPYTGDNTTNSVKGALEVIVNRWLSSTSAWFIIGEPEAQSGVRFVWRRKPDKHPSKWTDNSTKDDCYDNVERCTAGWLDPLNIYGNPGA